MIERAFFSPSPSPRELKMSHPAQIIKITQTSARNPFRKFIILPTIPIASFRFAFQIAQLLTSPIPSGPALEHSGFPYIARTSGSGIRMSKNQMTA